MMISILALLILFGGGAAVLGLIIYAIFNKKFWIIPAAGAVVFLGLMACGLFRARVEVTAPIQVAQQVNGMAHTLVQGPPNFNAYISAPSWTRILLIALVLGLIVRRWMSPRAGHGLRRGWPAIAVILFIAVMLLGSIRSDYRVSNVATEMAARQQIVIANQSAHIASQVSQQLAQSDIQDIEQFDAPRIPIRPDVTSAAAPKAPAAPAAPAQPAVAKPTDKSAVKPDKDDAKKPAAAPNHKRKKSDATTASNDNKQ